MGKKKIRVESLYEVTRRGKKLIGKAYVGTVDVEPTWVSLLWELIEQATEAETLYPEAKNLARQELRKMARAADAYRALQKAGKVP